MKIKTYNDMAVKVIQKTENPGRLIKFATDITQTYNPKYAPSSKSLPKFLLEANHTSVVEHAIITFSIEGVSRSFLAQITRHRMASYTASSQHYQDYSEYPHIASTNMAVHPLFKRTLEMVEYCYKSLIKDGIPSEEARQILPNSKAVNILWTINARSLINFLNLRLCNRNTEEIRIFAKEVHKHAMFWWPELFSHIGPDCYMHDKCTQGKMSCGEPYGTNE